MEELAEEDFVVDEEKEKEKATGEAAAKKISDGGKGCSSSSTKLAGAAKPGRC